jgi:hypothetical protein
MSEQRRHKEEIIADYADGPNRLETAIAGLSETDLDIALSSDSWTIRQIVHHIADGDDIWKVFIKRAVGDPGGEFSLAWYWQRPQDEWPKQWAYGERAIEPSLALFRAGRRHIGQLLEHIPGVWEQSLRIPWPDREEQEADVRWVMEMLTRHIDEHLAEIRRIRDAHNV